MMERYKGYWISGDAIPGPPYTRYWETLGTVLKDGRKGSVVEVTRLQDPGIKFEFDLAGFAELYGMAFAEIYVDHCLPQGSGPT